MWAAAMSATPAWASAERMQQADEAHKAGRYAEAARLYEEAVQHFQSTLGEKAHDTLLARNRLA